MTLKAKQFGKGYYKTFKAGIEREWVTTNGIGGYAGSSIIGAHTRKHHGLLIASLHAPTERFLVLSKVNETLKMNGKEYGLAAAQRKGGVYEEGQKFLQRFIYDELPQFVYEVGGTFVTKTISFEYGKNTIAIGYEIRNGMYETEVDFVPLFNFRDHNNGSETEDLLFDMELEGQVLRLYPKNTEKKAVIQFFASEGVYEKREEIYDRYLELQTEIDTGMSSSDNNFTPYGIKIRCKPFETKKVSLVCTIEEDFCKDAFATIEANRKRIRDLVEKAGWRDDFADALVQAADQFIVDRQSTGFKTVLAGLPWFTDWGRDTMIALQGLTLCTKRFEDARGILKTFARYVHHGLVPNMFPDEGLEPLYNTVDASLWYFYSVYKYLEYTGTEKDFEFIKKEIYPTLKEIIQSYKEGTDFSIYMEKDSLVHAGSDFDQVTWMDVRVGEWVVTPRHGKPVEINALWYNALKVMEELAEKFEKTKDAAKEYGELAQKVKVSFNKRFWNEEAGCLYDVVDEEVMGEQSAEGQDRDGLKQQGAGIQDNAQIRPNQIWAVSLPFTMLSAEKEKKVVDTVMTHLYASYGLRSLSPEDAAYKGIYFGELHDRDAAYHQGTVWAFPLGGFISAYVKVYGKTEEGMVRARKLIAPLEDHLMDGCIGSVAEIFDGDEPHISRGCYAQAWSVGEILRAYTEDILGQR